MLHQQSLVPGELGQKNSRQVDNASYAQVMPQIFPHGNPCKKLFASCGQTRPSVRGLPWYSAHHSVFSSKERLPISVFPCLSEKLTRSCFLAIFFFLAHFSTLKAENSLLNRNAGGKPFDSPWKVWFLITQFIILHLIAWKCARHTFLH